jgi:hypothetical protein
LCVSDPQNLSDYLRNFSNVPNKVSPKTASLLGTEAGILRQEFYKEILLNGDAHGKLNCAIEHLCKCSEEKLLQDKFAILPNDMVKRTFVADVPPEPEVDIDGDPDPFVSPKNVWDPASMQAAHEATQALVDAQKAARKADATSDTSSDRDGGDDGGAGASDGDVHVIDSDGDDNGKSPANESVIATSTTAKRSKKQQHPGGSPLTRSPKIPNDSAYLRPQFQNLLWPKEWPVYDFGMIDSVAKAPWPPGSKGFFQKHGDQEPQLLDMVAKLLDVASRPQTHQTWHRNPPKPDPSQSPQQGKGKDGKGKGKGGKGKGGNGRGRGKGKGKGKVSMPTHFSRQNPTPVKTSLFDEPLEESDIWGFDKATIEALSQEANHKPQRHSVWSDTSPSTPLSRLVLKVLKEARKGDTALFSALCAPEQPRLDMKLLTSKIKGKVTVEKQIVSNFLIAFPTKDRLVSRLDANHDYSVTDGTKNKNETTLTEEIVLAHRFNTVSQRVEFWPGSCYPFQENCTRSSILGARKEICAKTANHASHSFTQTHVKNVSNDKQASHGMDPATYKCTAGFIKGEPGNATEVLSLFIAEHAQCFVPIDQKPHTALWALEDAVHDALSQERSTMEALLLLSLRGLRDLAPTHFHFDVYSL